MKQTGFVLSGALLFATACTTPRNTTATNMNTGTTTETTQGATPLFNGTSLAGWHPYQGKTPHNWEAKDGILHCLGGSENHDRHADLVTDAAYENFDLSVDWKIAPQGNSGIIYLANETQSAAYQTGPEYQLIDDANFPEKLEDWQKTGANYAMNPAPTAKPKPVGEWNTTRILVKNGHVEHWLNGAKIVEYEMGSEAWKTAKATGKWKDTPTYGTVKSGHIALQDHGSEAWFRNITIKQL